MSTARRRILSLVFTAHLLVVIFLPVNISSQFLGIPSGNYCGGPINRCCDGRQDTCSTPLLGTLCYCDHFCNRTVADDCCPDYWQVCLGISPPAPILQGCSHEGQLIAYGQSTRINCNQCECRTSSSDPSKADLICESHLCLMQPDLITAVNDKSRLGWTASNYSAFWGRQLDDGLLLRLGTLEPERFVLGMHPIKQKYDPDSLPRNFDSRQQWPGLLQPIQDQGWCGSSWAFSTAAVASDRLAIQSKGSEVYSLSTQNLISCNNRGQQGCNGGHLDRAWNYLRRWGVVNEECYQYSSGITGTVDKCRVGRKATLLTMRCQLNNASPNVGSSRPNKRKELFRTPPAYRIAPKETDIMNEIRERGPVQATMKVHSDFFTYRGGVYRYSGVAENQRTGYHSVRIIGWGDDYSQGAPMKYWLVANSWGIHWGEEGYFRILRGENECDIETFVLAAWAESADDKKK